MGFIKDMLQARRIKLQIEKLQLKNQKFKLQNAIDGQKRVKSSSQIKTFLRTAQDIDELKGILDEKSPLLSFLESPAGAQVINVLISKFGGGQGATAALNLGEIMQNLTPEQKKKGAALLKEIVGGE